jgi:hypothetical protein
VHGVQTTINFGINFLELTMDTLMVKQALISNVFDMSEVGGLVTELKELLLLNFKRAMVVHNPRHCNKATHALAALGIGC